MPTTFHPDLRGARFLPRLPLGPRTLKVVRRLEERSTRGAGVVVERAGPVKVRVFRPGGNERKPALLWLHGGGMVMDSAWQDDGFCRQASAELGIVVAAVEYRVAPENPFPVPLDDCYAGLAWLADQSDVDSTRIALGGGSAGGGLAAGLALLARERGELRPVFQLLSYPMIDDRTTLRTDVDDRSLRIWGTRANEFGWRCYLGPTHRPGEADVSPLAAPARYDDLTGLPPAWLGVGTNDLFYDEDVAYAKRLVEAGVPCELLEIPGAYHGFDGMQPKARVSRAFLRARLTALKGALRP
ncbi:alpha/beta hydrolase [Amycolatopsis acidicola]|uniref:Alpha/beta hydrolase n=1 Tax=Amycolatopsis acidicola TaxID=2596893 RepID=A0A5N0VCC8_9PSEU|nr:alpha/beta hydrolase [Amycolatopsis acidicola]KAA9162973.1 alpha/beta hydrolase [Amycolatopsis acidicola]